MSIEVIKTRTDFREYVLRRLGKPVLEINMDDAQIDDAINDAIEFFIRYHPDGVERIYLKHQITQNEIDTGTIALPETVYSVVRILPFTNTTNSKNIFDLQYQLRLNDLFDLSSTSIIYYDVVMSHLALLDLLLNGKPQLQFNHLSGNLIFEFSLTDRISEGQYLIVECYRVLDPEQNKLMYNDRDLKRLAVAYAKRQWATNLSKFSGLALPGGVLFNADKMYNDALLEGEKIEQDIINNQAPLGFFVQ